MIDSAVDQYAIENNKSGGFVVTPAMWTAYLKAGTVLANTAAHPTYGTYGNQTVDTIPSVQTTAFADLSDVAPSTFWAPYYR